MKMNRLWMVFFAMMIVVSCKKSDSEIVLVGDWAKIGDFDGTARSGASSFTIGNKAYVCFGYNTKDVQLNDVWEYDGVAKTWTELTKDKYTSNMAVDEDYPSGRYGGTAFAIGTRVFAGFGYNAKAIALDDFWEFFPATGTWKKMSDIKDFPLDAPSARIRPVGVSIGAKATKGYVGTGSTGTDNTGTRLKDFYEYTPDAGKGKWKKITSFEGSKREGASTFVINDIIYLFGGINNSVSITELHSFDGVKWTKLNALANISTETFDDDYGDLARAEASTFVMNGLGYITCGHRNESLVRSTFQYQPGNDTWTKLTAFEGAARKGSVGFAFDNRGFVLLGKSLSSQYDDFWEFFPTNEQSNLNNN